MNTTTYTSSTSGKKSFHSMNESIDFLKLLWTYTSLDAKCYSITVIGERAKYKHFCIENYGDYPRLFNSIKEYLSKLDLESSESTYFQVLPLANKPEKGRGMAKDVKVGKWLWCDLDYKEVVDKPEFQGCRELEDYALECYYQDGDKWIHVLRPPLSRVLSDVRDKLGVEPTLVVDSGAGYHLYFKLTYELDSSRLKQLVEKLIDALNGDPQSKDLARILRLPGSINPRVKRLVKVVYKSTAELDPESLEKKLTTTPAKDRPREAKLLQFRELSDTEVLKIKELLKESYRPGYRQTLLLYLSGWLAKAGVSPISAVKIAKALYDSTQDSDPLRTRLSTVVYSYKKAGVAIDSYSSEIEALTGVSPYGLEKEIQEDKVKGVSGLQEILESVVGEEKALTIIHELSDMLNVLSPYRDSIIELLDYEKQVYAVANLRKLVIVRARRENSELRYKERVAVVAPTRVVVYDNPLGGVRKYEVLFEGFTLRRPLVVGPALVDEIADRLRAEGLVYYSKLLNDVLNAIIQAFIRKGKAEVKTEIESPGFYLVNDKIVVVRYDVRPIDSVRLRDALAILNELAETWFKHVKDKFATVVKLGAIAPFTYILKTRGVMQRYLYLYGDSATGKSTMGRIVLRMWGLDSRYEKPGASIDTEARLGYVLSQSTFPVLVNEPGGALIKEEVVEMIKSASEGLTARGKYVKGTYIDYPALAPLMFTSNKFLPRDDALLRRFIIIMFSYGEKIPREKQGEFKEKIEPRLHLLSEIGVCISNIVVNEPSVLSISNDVLALGEILLAKCYEIAGLEKPQWLGLIHEEEGGALPLIVEEFTERFKKLVNDLYAKYVSRTVEVDVEALKVVSPDQLTLSNKLRILIEKNMLPGIKVRDDKLLMLTSLLREIGLESRVSLKSLSEMLGAGFEYKKVKVGGNVLMAIVTTVDEVERLLLS